MHNANSFITNQYFNYHHCLNFYQKIEQILFLLKKDIIYNISYDERRLFKLFSKNHRLILFLFREKIISCSTSLIDNKLINQYFRPEFKGVKIEDRDSIFNVNTNQELPDDFEENRYLGENEHYVCKIIREDSIDEFIIYANKTNLSINSLIETSVFETNSFLKKHKVKLIEYAVFFGSIQIFQYLRINGAKLKPKLLLFAVHSLNAEMIRLIEEHVEINDKSIYKICYKEAIKCHHNDIAKYIRDQYLYDVDPRELPNGIKYSNYEMFPNINDDFMFFNLLQYDYKLAHLYKKEKKFIYDDFEINDEDYISDSIIGDGHLGETNIAEHKSTHIKYVYKIIEDEYVQFELIDKLMELKYPSLLNPIGFSLQYSPYKLNTFLLWFNYLQNDLLVKYISNGNLLNSTQKYIVILGLAIALNHLHKNGICHHSLHPKNILLDDNYYPVISDFTISNNTRKAYKRKNYIDDIISYYPPETMKYEIFTSSNVFSFALIMYELIIGKFIHANFKKPSYIVQYNILEGKIPEIEKVNSYIHDLLIKCWSFNPDDRPSFDQIIDSITNKEFFDYNFSELDNESVKKYLDIYGDEIINIKNKF